MAESKSKGEGQSEMSSESIKMIAESIGISTAAEDACKYLADDVSYRLQSIVQEALKLALHSKRTSISTHHIDATLKMKDFEPIYGFTSGDYIPFRNASGGGRELHFTDDKEIDLDDLISKPMPKIPLKPSLKAHWLAIEGIQPAIPENPPPVSRDLQKLEGVNPVAKASVEKLGKSRSMQPPVKSKDVMMKPLAEHDLSVEQQLYYKEITEACVGSDEQRRTEALTSLSQDPGLHKLLPRFSTFISEGAKVNCVNNNLAILIYLMRMLKSMLENSSLYLEKYLHELIPATITCVVSKQLCMKPETDNHWALRDFSAKLLGAICRKFTSSTNDIQTRVVKILSEALHNLHSPLSTHYGCVSALGELGPGVVQSFVLPVVKAEGERLKHLAEGVAVNSADKVAAQQVKQVIIKVCCPVLKIIRKPPDSIEMYRQEFGFFGPFLHEAVLRLRSQAPGGSSLLNRQGSITGSIMQPCAPYRPPHHSPYPMPSYYPRLRHYHNRYRPPLYMPPDTYHPPVRPPDVYYPPVRQPDTCHPPVRSSHYPHQMPARHEGYWPTYRHRTPGSVTVINPQHNTVSRSFSLPTGSRAGSQSSVIRVTGPGGASLVRTPTTPSAPGTSASTQKFIIMSSSASSIQSQPSPTTPTIVKVLPSASLTQSLGPSVPSSQTTSSSPRTIVHTISPGDKVSSQQPPSTGSQ